MRSSAKKQRKEWFKTIRNLVPKLRLTSDAIDNAAWFQLDHRAGEQWAARRQVVQTLPTVHHARNRVQVLALLRTLALNLLRNNSFQSIRAGFMAASHDISSMLSWMGITSAEAS